MPSVAAPWSLVYCSVPPSLLWTLVPGSFYVSVGLLEVQLLSPHSRKKEREEKGWPLPFKVTSQKYQTTLPLTYHWLELSHIVPSDYKGVLEMSFSWFIAVSNKLGICY